MKAEIEDGIQEQEDEIEKMVEIKCSLKTTSCTTHRLLEVIKRTFG